MWRKVEDGPELVSIEGKHVESVQGHREVERVICCLENFVTLSMRKAASSFLLDGEKSLPLAWWSQRDWKGACS